MTPNAVTGGLSPFMFMAVSNAYKLDEVYGLHLQIFFKVFHDLS
jgi:hypothetical protein